MIVGFDYTITGHAYKCTDCQLIIGDLEWQIKSADKNDGLSTNLSWNVNSAGGGSGQNSLNWNHAVNYCEGLSIGGIEDWRLPEEDELVTLIDTSNSTIKIIPELRDYTEPVRYWSSTVSGNDRRIVNFGTAGKAPAPGGYNYNVRCVRNFRNDSE